MKVWVFVEGVSDKLGLEALWASWQAQLRAMGWGIAVIPLDNKANFLRKIGARAAEKLAANDQDIVVTLPDLHPTAPFANGDYQHSDANALKALQIRLVSLALQNNYRKVGRAAESYIARLFASVFRHDFEMLLLAAVDALRNRLGTTERLGRWRTPVEDQNLDNPPKRIVEDLFLTKSRRRRADRDTIDAPAILRNVNDLSAILHTPSGARTCPEFVATLQWLGERTGVPVCNLS